MAAYLIPGPPLSAIWEWCWSVRPSPEPPACPGPRATALCLYAEAEPAKFEPRISMVTATGILLWLFVELGTVPKSVALLNARGQRAAARSQPKPHT